jgi:para-aminobenzoate synthetase component 2
MLTIVIIDNYDSFTYNLVQAIAALKDKPLVHVVRNDAATAESLADFTPTHLVISPGPGQPANAGISNDLLRHWAGRLPILGVCLGHQCIAEVFGGRIVRADRCMHGKTSQIHHDQQTIFQGLPNPFQAMRYHSLAVEVATLDQDWTVSARTETDEIMALRNKRLRLEGVQFHPESFLTPQGRFLLENFLKIS